LCIAPHAMRPNVRVVYDQLASISSWRLQVIFNPWNVHCILLACLRCNAF
jgi:hypothetical protein